MTNHNAAQAVTSNKKWKFVTHQHPDTDALLCLWLMHQHFPSPTDEVEIALVRAGEKLTAAESADYEVIYADTGGGKYDQHGKRLGRTSSFELMATDLGLQHRADIKHLIKLANDADSAEGVCDATSIHFLFRSLPWYFYDQKSKMTDWDKVIDFAFITLDSLSGQWLNHARQKERFRQQADVRKLANGLTVCCLVNNPGLRHTAFESGADVVCWTQPVKGGCYVGVQVSAKRSDLTLEKLVAAFRQAEIAKRKLSEVPATLDSCGQINGISGWFLHDSCRFVGCGTRAHPLEGEELTKLKPKEMVEVFIDTMNQL